MIQPIEPSRIVRRPPNFEYKREAYKRARREAWWLKVWQTKNWRTILLWPFSVVYEFIVLVRRLSFRLGVFDVYRAPVPVVVVGGILIGGVGKTPVVGALTKALIKAGYRPAIVARGYGGNSTHATVREVTRDSLPTEVGDEPLLHLLGNNVPVWVGANRSAVVQRLCEAHPEVDVILSDDGLQHYKLARDIEVVVMDKRGKGNGWCLPAGPLREPPTRLGSVDAVVWHHRCEKLPTREQQQLQSQMPDPARPNHFAFKSHISDAYCLADTRTRLPLSFFGGKDTLAIAGIAQPELFFKMLQAHNIHGHTMALPDHFMFDEAFVKLMDSRHVKYVLMTEKDAVKYQHLIKDNAAYHERFWVVPLEILDTPELSRLESFMIERLDGMRKK
ncbi:tetraacyldisaccharide 4'-kinase [Hydromonas duriensis]|uniref:Tetraacyldisaccharide 4'-kinase n=1 Tax=Hydromonas duriensis TaxID=1527608 RepID=A0A4V3DK80_9BURK|nr:tetraacyldisaccharide 4'-kinase [Hydromonas duriensis]TDR32990.1 lipid-A-disaccharide kinase [Hydromonas duriensis]